MDEMFSFYLSIIVGPCVFMCSSTVLMNYHCTASVLFW